MAKRRVKSKGKARPKGPAIHKFKGERKARPDDRAPSRDAEAKAAIHKFAGRKDEPAGAGGGKAAPPKDLSARIAAMMAASAEVNDEPDVDVKSKSSSAPAMPQDGVAWEEVDDEAPEEDAAGPGGKRTNTPEARPGDADREAGDDEEDDDPEGAGIPVAPLPRSPASAHRSGDDEAVLAATKSVAATEVDPGIQVVAKGASNFSAADLELLRSSIKVKGSAAVVDGINLDELKWDAEGLVPVVAQDRRTGAVLMLGHANRDTLEQSLRTKLMTYWNRGTGKPVQHGEESGHAQRLVHMAVDCDKDALLAVVEQEGPCCHRDTGTCWNDEKAAPPATFLGELDRIIRSRAKEPQPGSRTSKLLAEPIDALRAFVEQANELTRIVQGKSKGSLESGASDLLYNLLVTLRTKGVGLADVLTELEAQHLAMQMKRQKG